MIDGDLPGVTDILLYAVLARLLSLSTNHNAADSSVASCRSDNITSRGPNKLAPSIASADTSTDTSTEVNTKVKVDACVDAGIDTKPGPSSKSIKSNESSLSSIVASCASTGDRNPSWKVLMSIL